MIIPILIDSAKTYTTKHYKVLIRQQELSACHGTTEVGLNLLWLFTHYSNTSLYIFFPVPNKLPKHLRATRVDEKEKVEIETLNCLYLYIPKYTNLNE